MSSKPMTMVSEPGPAMPKPRAKGQPLRDLDKHQAEEHAIVRAAYRLISQRDTEPLAVQDILTETGLSTRAFYRHFTSKDDLITTMYRTDSQREMSRLSNRLAEAGSPMEAVVAWIDHWIAIIYDRKVAQHLRVLWATEARALAGFRTVESETNLMSITLLSQILAAGHHQGVFPTAEPDDDARVFQAAVVALLEVRLLGERPSTMAAARTHLASFIGRSVGCELNGA